MNSDNCKYIGSPENVDEIFRKIRKIAPLDVPVLITGKSGTGKELIAQAIHKESLRSGNLRIVNCAAIPSEIIESELFGHRKGSFTGANNNRSGAFQSAHGGTLFLDEIGDMPINAQAKLLRAIETKEVYPIGADIPLKIDFRIIAATNQDLEKLIELGKFRQDLYYRLNIFQIHLKQLRKRKEDLPFLVEYFIERYCQKYGKTAKEILETATRLFWLNQGVNIDKIRDDEFQKIFSEICNSLSLSLPFEIKNIKDRYALALALYNVIFEGRKSVKVIKDLFLKMTTNYTWPGNIRELDAYIQRLMVFEGMESVFYHKSLTKKMNKMEKREKLRKIIIEDSQGRLSYAFENYTEELKEISPGVSKSYLCRLIKELGLQNQAEEARINFLLAVPEKEWEAALTLGKKEAAKIFKVSFNDLKEALEKRKK